MTHYEVLGVSEGASAAEIKAAYKVAMVESHPDKFQAQPQWVIAQAEVRAKAINAAYTALRNRVVAQPAPKQEPKQESRPECSVCHAAPAQSPFAQCYACRVKQQTAKQAETEERDRQRRNAAQSPLGVAGGNTPQASNHSYLGVVVLIVIAVFCVGLLVMPINNHAGQHAGQHSCSGKWVTTDTCASDKAVQEPKQREDRTQSDKEEATAKATAKAKKQAAQAKAEEEAAAAAAAEFDRERDVAAAARKADAQRKAEAQRKVEEDTAQPIARQIQQATDAKHVYCYLCTFPR